MAARSHRKDRRSHSLFSFEHLRSFSRSAEHNGPNQPSDLLHVPSSFSCDPHQQHTNKPKATVITSDITANGLIDSPVAQPFTKSIFARLQGKAIDIDDQAKSRPRSWFSLSRASLRRRPVRSLSVPLPKGSSSSTVSKSIISAPVLTGTTNMDVAEAEGVCCRDIVDAGLMVQAQEARAQKKRVIAPELGLEPVKSTGPGIFHNATKGRREKLRTSNFDGVPPCFSENPSEDTWRFSHIEKGIARRRAEAVNLCRQKINKITGNGHIRRKSVHVDKENTSSENHKTGNGDIIKDPLHGHATKERGNLLSLHNNSDLAFGSLTRSFASAVDKLDFHSSPASLDMPTMKSKMSIFNMRKSGKKAADGDSGESSKTADDPQPRSTGEQPIQQNADTAKLMKAMKAHAAAAQAGKPKLVGAPPEPMQFSGSANAYVEAEPAAAYPRGIRALGMHSNTMEFATAPSWVTDLPKPPKHTPTVEEVTPVEDEEDDNEHNIQDAPIYSPSLGDLSQYARPSPSPTQQVTELEKRPEPDTPTDEPNDQSRRRFHELRKSASVLFDKFNKEKRSKEQEGGTIQKGDENQKEVGGRRLRMSRSMNFAKRFGIGNSTPSEAPPPLPKYNSGLLSQPTKPSPLRNEARVDEELVGQAASPHAAYKRTPPPDFHTPAGRAKRMGVVGMPRETEDTLAEQ